MPIIPTHEHYKGGLYSLLMLATQEADSEKLAIYQSCDDGEVWARPIVEFAGLVEVDGKKVLRFKPLDMENEFAR